MASAAITKAALIIGVGPGLGASLARRFAAGGYSIGLISRTPRSYEDVQKELVEKKTIVAATTADAGNSEQLKAAIRTLKKDLGEFEVLLYNAATFIRGGILQITNSQLEDCFKLQATGLLAAAQEVLPAQVAAGKGTILVTGATGSLRGAANCSTFASAKFAGRALAQSMAREFSPQGIHVAHIIVDGIINTGRKRAPDLPPIPLHAMLNPDDIADTYWFLHSQPKSTWTQELDLRPYVEKF